MSQPTMRAVVRDGNGVSLVQAPRPVRPPGWLRLRVLLAGICRTDLYAAEGLLSVSGPRILGHELVGQVLEADPGSAMATGTRVTVAPLLPCGACHGCRRSAACLEPRMLGVAVDGAFAEELVVPETSAHRVPGDLSLRRAAYTEPIAASLAVLGAPIRREQRGAVLGSGRIATLTARILDAHGFARVELLADLAADPGAFDFLVETSATEEVLAAALRGVRPGGVVVLKSRPPRAVAIDVARAVLHDVTLAAVGYGSFPDAVRLAGELPVDDLLGDVFPLEAFAAAFARARDERGAAKLFLSPTGDG